MLELMNVAAHRTTCGQVDRSMERGDASCLDPGRIARFVLGLAEEGEANKVIDHVRCCERCRFMVNTVSEVIETLD